MLEDVDVGKIDNLSFTYEKVYKTDSLQPSGCNGPHVYIFVVSVCPFVRSQQPFSAPRRPTLASEVPRKSSRDYIFKAIYSIGDSLDINVERTLRLTKNR